jgi:hypothetical protein
VITFTFNSPLAKANYNNLVDVNPQVDNLQVEVSEDGLSLMFYGDFTPDRNYVIELSARIRDRWGQSLGDDFIEELHTPPLPSSLNVSLFGWNMAFVRPDEPVLYANAVNIQNVSTTVAPLSLEDFFTLSRSYEDLQAYVPSEPVTYSQNLDLSSGSMADVKIGLTQSNNQLLPGLYYAHIASPQMEGSNFYLIASSQVNLTFKLRHRSAGLGG